jgi:hypothetical protein
MKLTLEEIDAELMRLPASPTTPEDTEARAAMMQRRFDVEAGALRAAAERAAAEKKKAWGLPLVNVPGDLSCVMLPNGRTVFADFVDGRRVMQLLPGDLLLLSVGNQAWLDLNPDLARTL